jgi:alcohol dehydrogenase YqhD (iron-dependent ADH family)
MHLELDKASPTIHHKIQILFKLKHPIQLIITIPAMMLYSDEGVILSKPWTDVSGISRDRK